MDGYHFEDALLTFDVDEVNELTLVSVVTSNVRGSL